MATAIFVSGTLHAVPITGEIHFVGSFTPTGGTGLADATGLSFSNPTYVLTATGDFAGIAPWTTVSFASFSFAPFTPVNLWNAEGFSLLLEVVNTDLQTETQLNLSGVGVLSGVGYTPTVINWNLQGGGAATFTFRADDIATGLPSQTGDPVPDSGNAALLLGVALIGLGASRMPKLVG